MEVLSAVRGVLAATVIASAPACAGELQFEAGQCRFAVEKDGTFYQSDRYTRNYVTPRCASIALADRFRDGPFGWRVGFVLTGDIQARDNVATAFDADAFQHNLVCNDQPFGGQGCLASVNAYGRTWGFSFAATYEYRLGPARLIADGGLFFFHHRFRNHPKFIDCQTCRPLGDYDESSGPFSQPIPLLGLTLRLGNVYATARYYWPAEHRALSLTDHSFTQLSTGLVFKY